MLVYQISNREMDSCELKFVFANTCIAVTYDQNKFWDIQTGFDQDDARSNWSVIAAHNPGIATGRVEVVCDGFAAYPFFHVVSYLFETAAAVRSWWHDDVTAFNIAATVVIYNKPTSVTDPLGLLTTASYDPATGNLLSTVADVGSGHYNTTRRFAYNAIGQVLTATDPLGTLTQFAYDGSGNPISVIRDCCGAGHLNQLTTVSYDAVGNAVALTDPNGNVAASTYDANRRPTSATAPAAPAVGGVTTSYIYDPDGHLLQTQQSAGGTVLRTTGTLYTLTFES